MSEVGRREQRTPAGARRASAASGSTSALARMFGISRSKAAELLAQELVQRRRPRGREVRPAAARARCSTSPSRGEPDPLEVRGRGGRGHPDHPRRRRHRGGRQAGRGRRTPVDGVDRADRRRPPARCRLPDRHQRRPGAARHRAAARRRYVGGDGDRQERARLLACSRTPSATARSTRPTTRSCRAIPTRSRARSTPRSAGTPKSDWKFAVHEDGKHSVTHYETLEAHRFASLLEVHLETGRTHQIRVHMAALQAPVRRRPDLRRRPDAGASGLGWSGSGCTPCGSASSTPAPGSRSSTSRRTPTTWPTPSRSSAMPTEPSRGAGRGVRAAAAARRTDLPAVHEVFVAASAGPGQPARDADAGRGAGLGRRPCSTARARALAGRAATTSCSGFLLLRGQLGQPALRAPRPTRPRRRRAR